MVRIKPSRTPVNASYEDITASLSAPLSLHIRSVDAAVPLGEAERFCNANDTVLLFSFTDGR